MPGWLNIHILFSVAGLLFLTLASIVSLLYLFQEHQIKHRKLLWNRLPSLEKLDKKHTHILSLGFLFFTIGVGVGWFVIPQNWQLTWRPEQLWTGSGWGIYALILFFRLKTGLRGRKAALYSLVGFSFVLFFWMVGVSIIFPGKHGWF
ncbi:MAG: hypothetical protein A3B70_00260 [Deltaproteobacteria bacterium RIFCSPHIGHO2_02_FULL_40_11]|nr:MAG: hypothetical protein A3B70_00260 [Deltaproteobacteria bacterium RIFCSPHIGHO2_02_FULL_40_11]